MRVAGHNRVTDWPKLGPSLLIATALVVAIRTARWSAKASLDAHLADVDHSLDAEVGFAIRVTDQVLNALLKRKEGLFPQRSEAFYEATEEDVAK